MPDRFTSEAHRALVLAEDEARAHHHRSVGPEHLLLGLIAGGQGGGVNVLTDLGVSLKGIQRGLEQSFSSDRWLVEGALGPAPEAPAGKLALTPPAQQSLEYARREAIRSGLHHVSTEHLLLGVIGAGKGTAASVLATGGALLTRVRQQIERLPAGRRDRVPVEDSPVVGRDSELLRLMRILSRRGRFSAVLAGPAGIGQTELIRGLAATMRTGRVPPPLTGRPLVEADLAAGEAGDLAAFLDRCLDDDALVCVENARLLAGGEFPALIDFIVSGRLQVILTVREDAHRDRLLADPRLRSRLVPLTISEPGLVGIPVPVADVVAESGSGAARVVNRLLPARAESVAVLVGAGNYRDEGLLDLPSVAANLTDLRAALTDPGHGVFDAERVHMFPDPGWDDVPRIAELAAEPLDTLLLYYAGHGFLEDELYLGLAGTRAAHVEVSSLPYSQIRKLIVRSSCRRCVVILDCCYSGSAIQFMADDGPGGELDIRGAYVLTATARNEKAHAPEGERNSAFTSALLRVLREGIADGGELIRIEELHPALTRLLRAEGRPLPRQRATDTISDLAIHRNPGWSAQRSVA